MRESPAGVARGDGGEVGRQIIVDAEWVKKKPPGYRGPRNSWKQWVPVTQLDPTFHEDEIDEMGGVEESLETYYFDQDLYDMILDVPEAEQPRKIEKRPDDAMDTTTD